MSSERVPDTLHLLVRRSGGGTETNIRRLCESVPNFRWAALEDYLGPKLGRSKMPSAISALRRDPAEVIFCYGITSHIIAQMAFPFGKPLVGNIRCETDFAGWKGTWKHFFGRQFYPWVSNSRKALGNSEGLVIYNGIPPAEEEEPLLPDLPRPVLGILASGHPKKGHDFFLSLWRSLGKPGSLVFAGNLPSPLVERAKAEGVRCPGFVPAGPLLRSLDLLLIPSSAEGIPTVMLEAMVRGIPVLATPVGGNSEIIRHGETGFILPREQWGDFLRLLPEMDLPRVGRAGQELVLREFTFERMKLEFIAAAQMAVKKPLG